MSSRAFRRAPISRRSFLKTSALTAGTLTLPLAAPFRARAADPLKPVTMTLDWLYEGTNVGFLVAHEQGFFREAGLDVAVSSGKGSGSTAQLVASKATQIGFSDGYVVGNGIAKGMAIKTVGSIFRRGPATIMVLAESSIKVPKDLEGKTVAMNASSAVFQQWPAFVKGAGIDAAKINIVNVDSAGLGPALISGKVDAIGGYPASYVPSIEILGKKERPHPVVRRQRRQRCRQRRRRPSGSAQERSRHRSRVHSGGDQGFLVRAAASRSGGRGRAEISVNR